MAREDAPSNAPTMIIPSGTQIQVDGGGQLSIRTPGNLVIQNSGSYGSLESVSGSIRIEPGGPASGLPPGSLAFLGIDQGEADSLPGRRLWAARNGARRL